MGCKQCKTQTPPDNWQNGSSVSKHNVVNTKYTDLCLPPDKEDKPSFANEAFQEETLDNDVQNSTHESRNVVSYQELVQHNKTTAKANVWIEREGSVYQVDEFISTLSANVELGKYSPFLKPAKTLRFTRLNVMGVQKSYIESAQKAAFVGVFQEPKPREVREDYCQEVTSLKNALQEIVRPRKESSQKGGAFKLVAQDVKSQRNSYQFVFTQPVSSVPSQPIPPGLKPIVSVCTRALKKLEILYLDHRNGPRWPGDPNVGIFPLPWGVKPGNLRRWLTSWRLFDTDVGEDGAWQMTPADTIVLPRPELNRYLRPWLDDWEKFDTTVEGEVAWKVIAKDLIKNDKMTKKQLAVERKRQSVKIFYDKRLVDMRRRKMVRKRFPEHLKTFDDFAKRMETNDKELNDLCKK